MIFCSIHHLSTQHPYNYFSGALIIIETCPGINVFQCLYNAIWCPSLDIQCPYRCHDIDAVHAAPGAETGNVSLSSGVRQALVKVTARQVYRLWLHFWFPVACNQA